MRWTFRKNTLNPRDKSSAMIGGVFSATPASGARRSGGCPGRTCPRAHLSAPPPASNSESGLRFQFFTNDRQADRSNRQFRPISLCKESEERFEGFSLKNWIEKGKLKNRKHSNMFLLRCKAGIMVFGILWARSRKATFDFICYKVLFRSKRTKHTYIMQIDFFKVFKMTDFVFSTLIDLTYYSFLVYDICVHIFQKTNYFKNQISSQNTVLVQNCKSFPTLSWGLDSRPVFPSIWSTVLRHYCGSFVVFICLCFSLITFGLSLSTCPPLSPPSWSSLLRHRGSFTARWWSHSLHNRRTQDHFFPKELSIDRPFGTKYLWADSNGDKSVLKVARFLPPPKVRLDSTFRSVVTGGRWSQQ